MSKSWQEVHTLLDDPYVDADTKEHLLAAYMRESGYVGPYGRPGLGGPGYGGYVNEDGLPEDVRQYYDKYKLRSGDFNQGSLDDVYADAQAESEEAGYSAGLTQDEIDQNTSTLDGMQAPVEGQSGGVEKSDEIFELARPALKVFENFLPVNDKVPGDSVGRYGKLKFEDIKTRYDEQMGISFKKFLDDAGRLRAAHETLSTLDTNTQGELNTLYRDWTGPAANASYQFFAEKISPNSADLLDYLSTSPDMVATLVDNLFAECKAKADTVMGLYQPTVGSATPEMAMKVVELAENADDRDKIMEVAAWVDSVCGSNIENTIRDDSCGLNDENKEYVQRECKKWIRNSFNQDLHENLYATFKQTCDDTLEAVDSYYEELNSYLKEYENKFAAAGATPPPGTTYPPGTSNPPPGSTTPPPSTSNPPGSGGPGQSGSTPPPVSTPPPSGPGGGPSTVAPPPPPTPPEIPMPPSSTDPSGSTDPSFAGPGQVPPGSAPGGPGDPGTGTPGTGPGGMPVVPLPGTSGPGGTGAPGAPGSGTPGAPKEATIKDGNRTITVGQPDSHGRSKVTVDDGKGDPAQYTVDWTNDPGEQPEEGVIRAENGKAVIQDGDAAITLEQVPGPTDRLKMTVDDGTPASYDVDFGPDSKVPGVPDVPPSARPSLPDVPDPSSFGGGGGGGGGDLGGGGGGGGGGSVGGGSFGGAETPGGSAGGGPQPGAMVGAGSPDNGGDQRAAASAGPGAGGGSGSGQGSPMGGGMPMGGMGGGGGQGGGDQTRQSKWRTTGQLFDDGDPAANFSGVVGRDPAEKSKPTPKR